MSQITLISKQGCGKNAIYNIHLRGGIDYQIYEEDFALFSEDEISYIPAQPGWFVLTECLNEDSTYSLDMDAKLAVVAWKVGGYRPIPVTVDGSEQLLNYWILAPNGVVTAKGGDTIWNTLQEFQASYVAFPRYFNEADKKQKAKQMRSAPPVRRPTPVKASL
jgi:hypothetical protein